MNLHTLVITHRRITILLETSTIDLTLVRKSFMVIGCIDFIVNCNQITDINRFLVFPIF